MTRVVALVVAAGKGDRLGAAVPKPLATIAGRPLLGLTLEQIEASPVEAIVVSVPPGEGRVEEVARGFPSVLRVVEGGSTRQDSVRAALAAAPDGFDVVVCHDAARPLASPALFASVIDAVGPADGVVPVIPVADTVKRLKGDVIVETVARNDVRFAQTPQAFRREALEQAHATAAARGWQGTDDASLLERAGFTVVAVPGELSNLKVTTPLDLRLASEILRG